MNTLKVTVELPGLKRTFCAAIDPEANEFANTHAINAFSQMIPEIEAQLKLSTEWSQEREELLGHIDAQIAACGDHVVLPLTERRMEELKGFYKELCDLNKALKKARAEENEQPGHAE